MTASYGDSTLLAYYDVNATAASTPATRWSVLSSPRNVFFWGPRRPLRAAPRPPFAAQTVTFPRWCSASNTGSFRLRGRNPDYFELHVEPAATGRVAIRKWGGGDLDKDWWQNGEQGHKWVWSG